MAAIGAIFAMYPEISRQGKIKTVQIERIVESTNENFHEENFSFLVVLPFSHWLDVSFHFGFNLILYPNKFSCRVCYGIPAFAELCKLDEKLTLGRY